jgi:DNA modification methylase
MHVELWSLDRLAPYESNPRRNEHAVEAVADSIRRFGFRQPIVVDADGVIVVGHTRWKAAAKLGLTEVPVHVALDLPPEQARAYRIADNKLNELAEWDWDLLHHELSLLGSSDISLAGLGFSPGELDGLLTPRTGQGLTDPDEVPGPPPEATCKPGDLWLLGEHRLLCGDSSSRTDLSLLVEDRPVHLVNTDPPYNEKVEPRSNNAIAAGLSSFSGQTHHQKLDTARRPSKAKATGMQLRAKDRPLANDFLAPDVFEGMLRSWFAGASSVLVPGGSFYIWGGYANIGNYPPALSASGLYFSQSIIWIKQHPVLTRKDFMGNHEWCFYGWKEGAAHRYFGPNNETDVWQVKKVSPQSMVHLTEKPVELARRAIEYSSLPGERVLDLFGGSGSTLIACQMTGRRGLLMELDPLYCDVIVQRWESFTGGVAQLGN